MSDNKNTATALDDERRVKVLSPGQLVAKRFFRNRLAMVGLIILVTMFVFSFIGGMVSPYGESEVFRKTEATWKDMAKHMVLPIVTLTIVSVGSLMRYTRTNMLEVLNADYIRTARAKGLPEKKVIYHHAFRNTLIPIITILGSSLPGLFGGAMITETLFQIPGIGYTSYQCLVQGDIPFTMFYMTFLAVLTLLGNLLADILYAVADPRVRIN